jgi:hypothetical protein
MGKNKIFVRKSDLVDDISVDEIFELCNILLGKVLVVH